MLGRVELLKSKVLTAAHGFPTRSGGVSQGPFATLNTGSSAGDDPAAVEENLRRLARVAGAREPIRLLSQVHGDRVIHAVRGEVLAGFPEADGQWTGDEGVVLGIRTADCLPVLLEDPVGRRVAAVHAGWRGVISEIVCRALDALEECGSRPGDLRVALGPAIQGCCFEVDGDLPDRFARAFGAAVVVPAAGAAKPHLDLARAVRMSLERRGVAAGNIEALGACTACDPRFFSYRRDGGRTGRQLSFISCCFATAL